MMRKRITKKAEMVLDDLLFVFAGIGLFCAIMFDKESRLYFKEAISSDTDTASWLDDLKKQGFGKDWVK